GDTLLGELFELLIEFGPDSGAGLVVGEELAGAGFFFGRIEGALREKIDVDILAGHLPVDVLDGNVFGHPGADPVIEAEGREFVEIAGVAGRQRLKVLEGLPVAIGPGNERGEGDDEHEQTGEDGRTALEGSAEQAHEEEETDGGEKDSAIGAE